MMPHTFVVFTRILQIRSSREFQMNSGAGGDSSSIRILLSSYPLVALRSHVFFFKFADQPHTPWFWFESFTEAQAPSLSRQTVNQNILFLSRFVGFKDTPSAIPVIVLPLVVVLIYEGGFKYVFFDIKLEKKRIFRAKLQQKDIPSFYLSETRRWSNPEKICLNWL